MPAITQGTTCTLIGNLAPAVHLYENNLSEDQIYQEYEDEDEDEEVCEMITEDCVE